MIYIGIDLHARQFNMAVLDQDNRIVSEETLPTSCQNLKAAVSAFAEGKSVVFEESTLAAWAFRVLQLTCPHLWYHLLCYSYRLYNHVGNMRPSRAWRPRRRHCLAQCLCDLRYRGPAPSRAQ